MDYEAADDILAEPQTMLNEPLFVSQIVMPVVGGLQTSSHSGAYEVSIMAKLHSHNLDGMVPGVTISASKPCFPDMLYLWNHEISLRAVVVTFVSRSIMEWGLTSEDG